jgi:hypothetical protein
MSRIWTTSTAGRQLRRVLAARALASLRRGDKLRRAARLAGVHPVTLIRWRGADAHLDRQFRDAFVVGRNTLLPR